MRIYGTYATAKEAWAVVREIRSQNREADMCAVLTMKDPPRTANRWAVIKPERKSPGVDS